MRSAISVAAALVGMAAGSPAPVPQMLDVAQLDAAISVATGPSGVALEESAAVASDVSVTTVAAPAALGLSRRTFLGGNQNVGQVINLWDCLLFKKCQTTSSCTPSAAVKTANPPASTTSTLLTTTTTTSNAILSSSTSTVGPSSSSTTTYYTTTTTNNDNVMTSSITSTTETPSTTTLQSTVPTTTQGAATTASPSSTGTCGVRGYDLQKPPAVYADGSGQYASFSACSTFCQAQSNTVLGFAYGNAYCLCYDAPVADNLNPVDSSPYIFYDMSCSASSSSTTIIPTGTATTSSGQACATQPEAGTYCGFINPEDPCAPQPDGYGPANLTVDAFMNNPDFHAAATSAQAQVPSSDGSVYNQVFKDLNASTSANSYLGLHTLKSYDVTGCASLCDNTALCTAFNIYIERDPSLNPSANDSTAPTIWGYWCPLPDAITNYKCTLWGSNIDASTATNQGETREQFQVVITGSDGYDKTNNTTPTCTITSDIPSSASSTSVSVTSSILLTTSAVILSTTTSLGRSATTSSTASAISSVVSKSTSVPTITNTRIVPATTSKASSLTTTAKSSTASTTTASSNTATIPTWGKGHNCGGKAVNNPKQWMGSKVFPGPYNPQVCADYAWAQNAANKASAVEAGAKSWTPCKYVNAVYYHKNGVPYGTYCNLYNTAVDSSYETYTGGRVGEDSYSCAQSWTFELKVDASFSKC